MVIHRSVAILMPHSADPSANRLVRQCELKYISLFVIFKPYTLLRTSVVTVGFDPCFRQSFVRLRHVLFANANKQMSRLLFLSWKSPMLTEESSLD